MLQFLPALLKGAQGAGAATGGAQGGGLASQFMQALGSTGSPNQSNKNVGMQFANAGMQAPSIPSGQQMLASVQQQQAQKKDLQTFNPLIQMLLSGGR